MIVTISSLQRVIYLAGVPHYLSQAGINRLLSWLFSNAELVRGWVDSGEYVFRVGGEL